MRIACNEQKNFPIQHIESHSIHLIQKYRALRNTKRFFDRAAAATAAAGIEL
jgi:hypothetical protein